VKKKKPSKYYVYGNDHFVACICMSHGKNYLHEKNLLIETQNFFLGRGGVVAEKAKLTTN
jgi:hypothetical protein